MPDSIIDGTGTGNKAKVNPNHRLLTLSVIHTEEHVASLADGEAYFANTTDTADTLTFADATAGPVLYLRNDSQTKVIIIQKIVASASAAGGVMTFKRNAVLGTIGANNVHTPANSNFGSSNELDATCYSWDETGTAGMTGLTNGTKWKTFITKAGPEFFPVDGTITLPKNTSLTIEYSNNTGGSIEFECGIRLYLDDSAED